jgi:hypothetical protein
LREPTTIIGLVLGVCAVVGLGIALGRWIQRRGASRAKPFTDDHTDSHVPYVVLEMPTKAF